MTTVSVGFESEGSQLAGRLYLPPEYTAGTRVPGIIVTGSWTTVKEQMAGLYAERLAERGFVTLAFDFRHWGASEGLPRQYESPERKIRDIQNAAAFLQSRPEVAADGRRRARDLRQRRLRGARGREGSAAAIDRARRLLAPRCINRRRHLRRRRRRRASNGSGTRGPRSVRSDGERRVRGGV